MMISRKLCFHLTTLLVILYVYFSIILYTLTPKSKSRLLPENASRFTKNKVYQCKIVRPKYRPPPLPDPVALLSSPGSGNTWLRHLLEESTGYLTGSVYEDYYLKLTFVAESVSDGSVLVVKLHEGKRFLREQYKAGILMIRNPLDAILSEFNRLFKGHLGVVNTSMFNTWMIDWTGYVKNATSKWENFNKVCLTMSQKPVHIVFYERLLKDTRNTLRGVLDFLNQTVSEEDLDCAIKNGEGMFRREIKLSIDPYTDEMHEAISQAEERVMKEVSRYMQEHNQTM